MRILQNVNLQVMKGEMVAIMGPSGSGKTTLFHVLTGVDTPDDGEIVIEGETFSQLTEEEKAFFRRKHMGMIFQDFQLLESLTVKENILLPLILERKEADIKQKRFSRIADVLGIEKLADKGITEISGGQKKRVAIGRALINEPDIIFGDEPTKWKTTKKGHSHTKKKYARILTKSATTSTTWRWKWMTKYGRCLNIENCCLPNKMSARLHESSHFCAIFL